MKRFFSLLLSIILLITASAACISASSESATAQLQEMYARGELLMAQGDYAGAATQFETLGAYSDASQMAMYCKGIMAAEDLGMYDLAVSAFQGLGDFKDSKQLITYYQGRSYQASADTLIESEKRSDLVSAKNDYDEATKIYSGLALFRDCLTRLSVCQSGLVIAQEKIHAYDYAVADKLEQDGKYEEAIKAFKALGSYSDSTERVKTVQEKIYARDYDAADKLEQQGKYEVALKAFKALGNYSNSRERVKTVQEKIYARDYAAAEKLEQDGKYEEAIEAFKALGSYSNSRERAKGAQEKIYARDYAAADKLEQQGKYEEAISAFEALGNYSDSAERTKGAQEKIYARDYAAADKLEQNGKNEEAIKRFKALGSYSDSTERVTKLFKKLLSKVGSTVEFGTYEQDDNKANGPEPIEWIVLAVQNKKALLISKYALDQYHYHHYIPHGDVTWETCELRSWLNKTFLDTAFNASEQSAILTTLVNNSREQGNSKWDKRGEKNTNDKLFLLSYAEAGKYFLNDADRMCVPTDYASANVMGTNRNYKKDGQATCRWWLRSPGESSISVSATTVDYDGSRHSSGSSQRDDVCVRPAFWLNLESDIF